MSLKQNSVDLDALIHPARAYKHPRDVVADHDLTLYEKRAILSSWASDACAVQDYPELRDACGVAPVKFDDVMDALHKLDCQLERRVYWGGIANRRKDPARITRETFPLCSTKSLAS